MDEAILLFLKKFNSMPISIQNAEHYTWGSGCDGWHLLKSDSLSIIQERMPPTTAEQRHFHHHCQQLFYILAGKATFILGDETYTLLPSESIHVPKQVAHQIQNNHTEDLHFLVISEPKSHGDRTIL